MKQLILAAFLGMFFLTSGALNAQVNFQANSCSTTNSLDKEGEKEKGLLVFDQGSKSFWQWDGTKWVKFNRDQINKAQKKKQENLATTTQSSSTLPIKRGSSTKSAPKQRVEHFSYRENN